MVMDGVFVTWPVLLMVLALSSLVYLLKRLFFQSQRNTQIQKSVLGDGRFEQLAVEVEALKSRVAALEDDRESGKDLEGHAPQSVFDYAIQYAKEGMLPHEIATRTGISISEATLIVTMYKEGR